MKHKATLLISFDNDKWKDEIEEFKDDDNYGFCGDCVGNVSTFDFEYYTSVKMCVGELITNGEATFKIKKVAYYAEAEEETVFYDCDFVGFDIRYDEEECQP